MPSSDGEKLSGIEELKSKLASRNFQTRIEHRDNFGSLRKTQVPDAWQAKDGTQSDSREKFFMKTSVFKNFFIGSAIFFLLTLGYAAYVFFAGGNTVSSDNIDISILGNSFTAGGEPLPLIIGVTNRNNSPLELVDLVVEYPKGSAVDLSGQTETQRDSLGTIPAGATRNENVSVTLFGGQGSTLPVKVSIEYRVEGSNAIFVKDKLYQVSINSTPMNLSVNAPPTVNPNQNLTMNVQATLNSTATVQGVLLKVDYPDGFQFISATPAPSLGNNVWNLGDLAPGATNNISITGKLLGVVDGEQKTFNISSGSQSATDKSVIDTVYNSLPYVVTVKNPLVEANIFIGGVSQQSYAVDSKTKISGQIEYVNNSDTEIDNLVIQAKISGNAFDPSTISADQGFYDSTQNMITWNKSSVSALGAVNPGGNGSVGFSISPLALFSAAGGVLSSPSINLNVSISGEQSTTGFAAQELDNSSSATINIISDVGLATKAFYYSGPFANTGPIPPKVGQTTTYTVTWTLSNTANNISNAAVNATLPFWMNFTGPVSPTGENLTYDPGTKEIVWDVGNIGSGTGISGGSRSVSFQVSLNPSLSQVGSTPTLINDAILTGHDDFANVDVKLDKQSLNTQLDSDPQFPPNGADVVN